MSADMVQIEMLEGEVVQTMEQDQNSQDLTELDFGHFIRGQYCGDDLGSGHHCSPCLRFLLLSLAPLLPCFPIVFGGMHKCCCWERSSLRWSLDIFYW